MTVKNKKTIINVALANSFNKCIYEPIIINSVCAVIDTLRATSSMSAIFGSGCKRIILAKNKDEAYSLKEIFREYILCGEEEGLPPEGFDYGNSPYEFSKLDLKNKNIIMMTTNGTVSFFRLIKSDTIFALSLLNLSFVLNQMHIAAKKNNKDIFILCSGKKGHIAYDDAYNAGMAVKYLADLGEGDYIMSDSAQIVFEIVKNNNDIVKALESSCSGLAVRDIGHDIDIDYCSEIDKYSNAQVLKVIDLISNKRENIGDKYDDIFKERERLRNNGFEKLLLMEDYLNL
ncbi:MAG: 2-phosphosulfolactate phosphatase [Actinomycetota bacterium]|nr:2-phosphosulfolactate phosphatase [Actinomycetota bacterium]